MSEETLLSQTDPNLHSAYRLCHAVISIMERRSTGSIIVNNNASIPALRYIGKP